MLISEAKTSAFAGLAINAGCELIFSQPNRAMKESKVPITNTNIKQCIMGKFLENFL